MFILAETYDPQMLARWGVDLFRKCGEALSQRTARFSNCAGLRKLSAECRRVGL
jgi:hypothetical protein